MKKWVYCLAGVVGLLVLVPTQGAAALPEALPAGSDGWHLDQAISDEYQGTYIPDRFMACLAETRSYARASALNDGNGYHDVLAVHRDHVSSNSKFHDQYGVEAKQVRQFVFSRQGDRVKLVDDKGHHYTRISAGTDYVRAVEQFVCALVLGGIAIDSPKIVLADDGRIKLWDQSFRVCLDAWLIPLDDNLILQGGSRGALLGLQRGDGFVRVYSLLPDEDLRYRNDELILECAYRQREP